MAPLECYAFRKSEEGGARYETMEEHVGGMLKYLGEIWEYKAFLSKYEKVLGVERDIIDSLIRLAIVLHDFGKTIRDFQERCDVGDCEQFPYHYAISARLAMKLVEQLKVPTVRELSKLSYKPPFGALYVSIVVLPILLHHYAWITEESLVQAVEETKIINEVEIYEPCRAFYIRELERLKRPSKASHELSKVVEHALEVLTRGNRVKLASLPFNSDSVNELVGVYRKISPLITLVEASTGIINICDGRVAWRNRVERFRKPSLS
jgi:CRISPR/Cas system-associated endonuclease Cas3-HD